MVSSSLPRSYHLREQSFKDFHYDFWNLSNQDSHSVLFQHKNGQIGFPSFETTKIPHILHPSTGVVLTKTVTPYLRHTNPTKGLSEFYPERILPMMNQTTTYCNDLLSIFSTIASIKEKITERRTVPLFLPKRPSPYSYFALLV